MSYLEFRSYILGRLPAVLVDNLRAHFDHLEPDVVDYKNNGFHSRSRRFGAFAFTGERFEHDPALLEHFNKPKKFHAQTVARHPAPLTEASLASGVCDELLQTVLAFSPLKWGREYFFGINFVRVRANDQFMGAPAPGFHQDGYDYSCHINVARQNVSGGTSILAEEPSPDAIAVECDLKPGEFVFFNDRTMYHTASPVTPRCGGHETWRDMIIVDIVAKPLRGLVRTIPAAPELFDVAEAV
ncbi:2OG-Fe dioxygenase family protein [Pendulispora albinea]|uniref:2OG-Fe dioxygenase family protein n=1 Tax=Pendulispora albinea TaxID=2741071 RepID=A0ABZ2M940_9BACT